MQSYILGFLLRFRAFRAIYHSFLHLKKVAFCYVHGLFKGSALVTILSTYNYAINNHAMDTQEARATFLTRFEAETADI